MRRKTFSILAAVALTAASFGCAERRREDRVNQGVQGPSSPIEAGQHGVRDAEHQTAGLNGEITNGKVDATMEGSGNLGWQGSYEREKRAKMQAEGQTQQKPAAR